MNGQGRGRQKRWSGPRLLQIPFLNINDSNDHIGVCNVKKIPQYWKQNPVLPWDDGESHPQNKSRSTHITSNRLLAMIYTQDLGNIGYFLESVELSSSFKIQFQFLCSDTPFLEFALSHSACPSLDL